MLIIAKYNYLKMEKKTHGPGPGNSYIFHLLVGIAIFPLIQFNI